MLSFSASGPKAAGTIYVAETLRARHWVILRLQLEIQGRDRRTDLVGRSAAMEEPSYPSGRLTASEISARTRRP